MSHPHLPSTTAVKSGRRCKLADRFANLMKYDDKDKWLKDMRASLSLTVSIIATITFQSALNPPGGVMQVDFKDFKEVLSNCTSNNATLSNHITLPCPGQAILYSRYPGFYQAFLVCNSICFGASLSVCLLLVSGFSLNYAFITWLLLFSMWVTITSLALTYMFGTIMVTPYLDSISGGLFGTFVIIWTALFAVVFFVLSIRFVVWSAKRIKSCNGSSATPTRNGTTSISGA